MTGSETRFGSSKNQVMPIFMDLHIVPGISAKDAAEAHREDLKIQDRYNCRCMTYWVDELRGSAFCLVDAPSKDSVRNMHDKAHGLIPHEIIQVNSNVVEAFLGRIQDPKGFNDLSSPDLKIFNDPAFRIILCVDIKDRLLVIHELGKEKAARILDLYISVVRENIQKFSGREIPIPGQGFILSFISVTDALEFSLGIQKSLHIAADLIDLRIGLNAGMPVENSDTIFGNTINFSRTLCALATGNQIVMAPIIRELSIPGRKNTDADKSRFRWIDADEEKFLKACTRILDQNWNNSEFNLDQFCDTLAMSQSKLYRKSKTIFGVSPNTLLRNFRLSKSLDLLCNTELNISQVAFDSGFNSTSYFIKCFHQHFDMLPLSYRKLRV